MRLDRNTVLIVAATLAIGWFAGSIAARKPGPLEERPVLRWIASAAKSLLWIALVAEDPPPDRHAAIQATVGADGYVKVDHGRGW